MFQAVGTTLASSLSSNVVVRDDKGWLQKSWEKGDLGDSSDINKDGAGNRVISRRSVLSTAKVPKPCSKERKS